MRLKHISNMLRENASNDALPLFFLELPNIILKYHNLGCLPYYLIELMIEYYHVERILCHNN